MINSGRWSTFGDVVTDLEGRDIYTTKPTPQEMCTMNQVSIRREQKKNGFCGPDPAWMAPAFWMTPAFQREAACGLPVAGLRLFAGVDGKYLRNITQDTPPSNSMKPRSVKPLETQVVRLGPVFNPFTP